MVAELYESDIRPSELEQRVRSMQRRDIESQFLDSTGGGLRPERVVHVGCLCGGQAQCQASFTKLGGSYTLAMSGPTYQVPAGPRGVSAPPGHSLDRRNLTRKPSECQEKGLGCGM